MRVLIIGLLAIFQLVLAAQANAQADPSQDAGAGETKGQAHIVISPQGDELQATITLDRPVERLALDPADVVRDDTIRVATSGLSYADNAITGDAPFMQVSLRLIEDMAYRDAKYAPYYRVGGGRLLYAQTLYPDLSEWDVTLALEGVPAGWTRWPAEPLPQGYLFLGPESMIEEAGGAFFVFDGQGDAEFREILRRTVTESLGWLSGEFGSDLAEPAFIATNLLPERANFNRGSVTDNAIIVLWIGGDGTNFAQSRAQANLRSLILHEGVHFWNGGVAHFAQGTPMWLHEGGAEYIATLGSYRLGWTDGEHLRTTFASWLDRCSTSLGRQGDIALDEMDFIPSNIRYTCGPLLHLLGELYLSENGGGSQVTDTWRQTVATAAAMDGREYTLADWVAASGDADLLDRPALAAILATSGLERWAVVDAELARMGVTSARVTNPPLRARTALMFLIRSQCTQLGEGQGYGFYANPGSYPLDTPEGCGLLKGDPEIESLAGFPVTALTAEHYAALQAICDQRSTVAFGVVGGDAIEVPCPGPLAEADTATSITGLPDISAFAAP